MSEAVKKRIGDVAISHIEKDGFLFVTFYSRLDQPNYALEQLSEVVFDLRSKGWDLVSHSVVAGDRHPSFISLIFTKCKE